MLYDLHCHIDFARDAYALAQEASAAHIAALSATVTPSNYDPVSKMLAPYEHLHAGLGLHPWWLADGRCSQTDVELFCALAPQAPVIGEIGLDFSGERKGTRELQSKAFNRMLAACMQNGDHKLITLHSSRAGTEVLDALERAKALEQHACIFHWFSGTNSELDRARRAGCYFSINERMLNTKRGQAYARAIDPAHLLIETDAPPHEDSLFSAAQWVAQLERTLHALAEARNENPFELKERVAQTSCELIHAAN